MTQIILNDKQLKFLMKEAMLELFQEQKDIFHELFLEAMEEVALIKAIDEGMATESVSRKDVFDVLENAE